MIFRTLIAAAGLAFACAAPAQEPIRIGSFLSPAVIGFMLHYGAGAWVLHTFALAFLIAAIALYFVLDALVTNAVVHAGTSAEIDSVALAAPDGSPLLRNGDFSTGLAHWLPAAQVFFVPWHIDNLYLELLIERGVAGLSLFLLLAGRAAWRLAQRGGAGDDVLPWLAASLAGVLALGLVSSVFDVPRVALLLVWIVASGLLRSK